MTSINAIRFNHYEGACICDESITSTDNLRIDVSDKIQSCIPAIITQKYGLVASVGTTGSCSIGDQLKLSLMQKLARMYEMEVEKHGKAPVKFVGLREVGQMIFDLICDMKYEAISSRFQGLYGFSVGEFMEGSYQRNKETIEIKDKETIRELGALLSWKNGQEEVAFIFNNAALMAGYDDETGFAIYHYDLRGGGYWNRVQNCYLAEGSGRHSFDPAMYGFAENLLVQNRRGDIDRVAGLMAFIHGINCAMEHEICVGGYPNITLFDGRQSDYTKRVREISDERALLAAQIVKGVERKYLNYRDGYQLIGELMYGSANFDDVYDKMFAQVKNVAAFTRMLRGYKILPHHEDIVS